VRDSQTTLAVQKEIGRRIRDARLAAGLTQEEAAAAAGIDTKRWQRLEQGSVNATVRTLARVSAALGMTFWALVGAAPPAGAPKAAPQKR
jgi:transcriptional regulator with XRE-family HTH domain